MPRSLPVLLLLLAYALPAFAAELSLVDALKRAQDQQFEFQDRQAIQTLQAALAAFKKKKEPPLKDASKLGDAYLFMAFCHRNLGEPEKVREALNEAARLNPTLIADERLFPPSLAEQFELAKDRIWREGRFGSIRVDSNPPQASVFVNGAFKGKTPLKLNQHPVGTHYVQVSAGKKEAYRVIDLDPRKPVEVRFKLK